MEKLGHSACKAYVPALTFDVSTKENRIASYAIKCFVQFLPLTSKSKINYTKQTNDLYYLSE